MKTNTPLFRGAATALVTPMKEDGSVDFVSLGQMMERQIACGIKALLVLGTTGEASTLTDKEKEEIICFSVEKVRSRCPLLVGTGTNDTARTVKMSRFAERHGASGLLVVTPYYNKTTESGLIRHYQTVADAVDCPILLYNIPSRTGMTVSLPVYEAIEEHENIVGVKEASGNMGDVLRLRSRFGNRFSIYSGNDSDTLPVLSLGGDGVISVLSCVMPQEMIRMCELFFEGKTRDAEEIARLTEPLVRALFSEVNPIPVKAACAMLGTCTETLRPPLCPLSDPNRENLKNALKSLGLQ